MHLLVMCNIKGTFIHIFEWQTTPLTYTTPQLEMYASFCLIKRICSTVLRLNVHKVTCFFFLKLCSGDKSSAVGEGKAFVSPPSGTSINISLGPPPSLSTTKLTWCQMAKICSEGSLMPFSFSFANSRRVKSTESCPLALWWYPTGTNVIMTVSESC